MSPITRALVRSYCTVQTAALVLLVAGVVHTFAGNADVGKWLIGTGVALLATPAQPKQEAP
jgi:hypothetical protein